MNGEDGSVGGAPVEPPRPEQRAARKVIKAAVFVRGQLKARDVAAAIATATAIASAAFAISANNRADNAELRAAAAAYDASGAKLAAERAASDDTSTALAARVSQAQDLTAQAAEQATMARDTLERIAADLRVRIDSLHDLIGVAETSAAADEARARLFDAESLLVSIQATQAAVDARLTAVETRTQVLPEDVDRAVTEAAAVSAAAAEAERVARIAGDELIRADLARVLARVNLVAAAHAAVAEMIGPLCQHLIAVQAPTRCT